MTRKQQIQSLSMITPSNCPGLRRTGTLRNMTCAQVQEILGFSPNIEDDPTKVVNSWGFKFEGKKAGIWDYKGSHKFGEFSTFGPHKMFRKLFGHKYVAD